MQSMKNYNDISLTIYYTYSDKENEFKEKSFEFWINCRQSFNNDRNVVIYILLSSRLWLSNCIETNKELNALLMPKTADHFDV